MCIRDRLQGQLAGAIQMGLGYGLCEDMAYDGEGKPLVQTLKKYKVLRASQMPKLYMDFVETPQGAVSYTHLSLPLEEIEKAYGLKKGTLDYSKLTADQEIGRAHV